MLGILKRLIPVLGLLLCAIPQSAHATITATAKTCATQTGSAVLTATCTWSANPVIGEAVACAVFDYASPSTFSVTDSNSNSYTSNGAVITFPNGGGSGTAAYMQTFHFLSLPGTITTTSVTVSGVASGIFLNIQCDTATGVATSSATDGQASGDSGSGLVSTQSTSTPIVTNAADWIFCGVTGASNAAPLAGTGFTLGAGGTMNNSSQYLVQSVAASITPNINWSGTGNQGGLECSAYKPAGASVPLGSTIAGPSKFAGPTKVD